MQLTNPNRSFATVVVWACALGVHHTATVVASPPLLPSALLTVSIDGGAAQNFTLLGLPTGNGQAAFTAIVVPPGGSSVKVDVAVVVDSSNNPSTSITGSLAITNASATSHTVVASFHSAICPALKGGSLIGATSTIKLTTLGPGSIGCIGMTPIVRVLCGGAPAASLFICPFSLSIGGPGELAVTNSNGLPGPTLVGPPEFASIGISHSVLISAGAVSTLSGTVQALDVDGTPIATCPADLNGSGAVNAADLTVVLSSWGLSNPCPSSLVGDLNANGIIDGADLTILLNGWGACPP